MAGAKPVNEVRFSVTGARKIIIEGCKTTNASEFKKVGESKGKSIIFSYIDLANKQGVIQADSVKLSEPAPYSLLKFIIQEGWDDFSSVHNIEFA